MSDHHGDDLLMLQFGFFDGPALCDTEHSFKLSEIAHILRNYSLFSSQRTNNCIVNLCGSFISVIDCRNEHAIQRMQCVAKSMCSIVCHGVPSSCCINAYSREFEYATSMNLFTTDIDINSVNAKYLTQIICCIKHVCVVIKNRKLISILSVDAYH